MGVVSMQASLLSLSIQGSTGFIGLMVLSPLRTGLPQAAQVLDLPFCHSDVDLLL